MPTASVAVLVKPVKRLCPEVFVTATADAAVPKLVGAEISQVLAPNLLMLVKLPRLAISPVIWLTIEEGALPPRLIVLAALLLTAKLFGRTRAEGAEPDWLASR